MRDPRRVVSTKMFECANKGESTTWFERVQVCERTKLYERVKICESSTQAVRAINRERSKPR